MKKIYLLTALAFASLSVSAQKQKLAAKEMLDSLWAKQTPNRAKELAKQMETGEAHGY